MPPETYTDLRGDPTAILNGGINAGPIDSPIDSPIDGLNLVPPTRGLSADLAIYRMRCPRCQRLYSVHSNVVQAAITSSGSLNEKLGQISGQNLGLQFQCQSETCKGRFEVALVHENDLLSDVLPTRPLEVATEPVPYTEAYTETPCPKCEGKNALAALECRHCGVVFAKLAKKAKDAGGERLERLEDFGGRRELAELWTALMRDYENREKHERFVEECYRTGCLSVAAQRYARILVTTPNEEIAKTMRRRIIGLASFKTESVVGTESEPEPTMGFRFPKMNNIILMLGGAVMTMGFLLPGVRDLVGLGAAAVALGIGVRFFLSPKSF